MPVRASRRSAGHPLAELIEAHAAIVVGVDEVEAGPQFRVQPGVIHLEHDAGEFLEADAAIAIGIDAIEYFLHFILHEAGDLHGCTWGLVSGWSMACDRCDRRR